MLLIDAADMLCQMMMMLDIIILFLGSVLPCGKRVLLMCASNDVPPLLPALCLGTSKIIITLHTWWSQAGPLVRSLTWGCDEPS